MHEHKKPKECKHELKHCTHCDVVYCDKCKREWGKQRDYMPDYMKGWEKKSDPFDPKPMWESFSVYHKHKDDQREVI